MQNLKTSSETRLKFFSVASAALAVVGTIVAFFVSFASRQQDEALVSLRESRAQVELAQLRASTASVSVELDKRRAQIESELAAFNAQLASVVQTTASPTPARLSAAVSAQLADVQKSNAKVASDVASASEQLKTLEKRFKDIESVILTDAAKALSLPLLQRDVQTLGQQIDRGLASAKSDSDRIYDLMKWVLGLMGAVSLSLVGTAVGSVFKKDAPKSPPSKEEADITVTSSRSPKSGSLSVPSAAVGTQGSDA